MYRGAGLASDFVRASCASCPAPWIETLTVMGHLNPFFEKAGSGDEDDVTPSGADESNTDFPDAPKPKKGGKPKIDPADWWKRGEAPPF